jgi:hypothetical protein
MMKLLIWTADDHQGLLLGAEYESLDDAREASAEWAAELLGQCATDDDREAILAGSISCTDSDTGALLFVDAVRDI